MAGNVGYDVASWRRFARRLWRQAGVARDGTAELVGPRLALLITLGWLSGYFVTAVLNVFTGAFGRPPGDLGLTVVTGSFAVTFLLQTAHSLLEPGGWSPWTRALTLSVQAAATYLPAGWIGVQAFNMAPLLAGSILLAVSGLLRWALYVAVAASVPIGYFISGLADIGSLVYGLVFVLLTSLVVYGISSLKALGAEVHAARGDLARMAVTRERLRVARDLHDLLGHHLSAMALKTELAYRLLPQQAERARAEVASVLVIARRALSDIRLVASGGRHMSLDAELEFAASTLAAAEIEVRIGDGHGTLPKSLDTVFAIVVREAVTNVLRHSKAEHCEITVTQDAGRVRLQVANDGTEVAPRSVVTSGGNGLGNLTARLQGVDGELSVSTEREGWFELTVDAPVARPPVKRPELGEAEPAERRPWMRPWSRDFLAGGAVDVRESWVGVLVTSVVLIGYAIIIMINALLVPSSSALGSAAAVGCVMLVFALQIGHSFGSPRRWPWQVRGLTLSVQALASYLPLLWLVMPWGSMAGFLAGSILLVVAGPWRWGLYAVVGGSVPLIALGRGAGVELLGYLTVSTLITGITVFGVTSLAALVLEAQTARTKLAQLAVTQERLRVARELHDSLGASLSGMTLRGELAHRLLPHFPGRARTELANVLEVARRGVAEVRSVASAYRHVSLASEVDSAVSTMSAAGVEVSVDVAGEAVPEDFDAVLGVVLREAATNVLRHSDARSCAIEVAPVGAGRVRLSVVNDGIRAGAGPPAVQEGSGLGDLSARLTAIGGCLGAQIVHGTLFSLVADFPEPAETGQAGRDQA